MVVIVCFGSKVHEEFAKEFGIPQCTFDSDNIFRFTAVTELHAIKFEVRDDQDKVIAVHHCFKLCLFEMWS